MGYLVLAELVGVLIVFEDMYILPVVGVVLDVQGPATETSPLYWWPMGFCSYKVAVKSLKEFWVVGKRTSEPIVLIPSTAFARPLFHPSKFSSPLL